MQWRVDGADKTDGRDVTLILDADNGPQAEEIARNRNLLVSSCRKAKAGDVESNKAPAASKPQSQDDYQDTAAAASFLRGSGVFLLVVGCLAVVCGVIVMLTSANAATPAEAESMMQSGKTATSGGFVGAIAGAIIFGIGHLVDAARQIAINTAHQV